MDGKRTNAPKAGLSERGMCMEHFIEIENLKKTYGTGDASVDALCGVSLTVDEGELCCIIGPSGAGKTTLLNILGGMDTASEGSIKIAGEEITAYSRRQLTLYRRNKIGFVFQFYNLIQNLNALENVRMAKEICRSDADPAEVLRLVGLGERMHNYPAGLSGGEQQRVTIARALVKNPTLLLCDEPTGALDYKTGKQILGLIQSTARSRNMTVLLVTHNAAIAPMADRVIHLKNGIVERMEINEHTMPAEEIVW